MAERREYDIVYLFAHPLMHLRSGSLERLDYEKVFCGED